jgi:hypothetical protein
MLVNLLIWALAGIVMAALANAARWGIGAHRGDLPLPWLLTLGLGTLAGIIGGVLGSILFSDLFGLPAALALAAIGVVGGAWGLGRATSQPRTTG